MHLHLSHLILCLSLLLAHHNLQAQRRDTPRRNNPRPARIYTYLPAYGHRVSAYPANSRLLVIRPDLRYYYHNGVFYLPEKSGYVIVRPVKGVRVQVLPATCIQLHLGDIAFFYHHGVFFRAQGQEYEVVAPPVGAVVAQLPEDAQRARLNGYTYYILDGVYYKALIDAQGEIRYQVVGQQLS